ncbi:hypothetical protein ES703_12096 [subsurface metagenome]|nr:hypothetical protein [bacterium]
MKKFVSTLIILSMIAVPIIILAEDAGDACLQAQMDAERNVSGPLWFGAGCLFGILGVGAAYLIEPSPSAVGMLGKSPEYVAVYTDCYKDKGSSIQTKNAWTGCLIGSTAEVAIYTIYVLLIVATYAY